MDERAAFDWVMIGLILLLALLFIVGLSCDMLDDQELRRPPSPTTNILEVTP